MNLVVTICGSRAADPQYSELRFVLRTAAKNLNPSRLILVGTGKPSWCAAEFVRNEQNPEAPKNHHILSHLMRATSCLTTPFVWAADDNFILKPSVPDDFAPRREGLISAWTREDWAEKQSGKYALYYSKMWRTLMALRLVLPPDRPIYNFDSHHPVLIDPARFIEIMGPFANLYAMRPTVPGVLTNTYYFNAIGHHLHVSNSDNLRAIGQFPTAQHRFWNVNDHSQWPAACRWLAKRYPDPSPWERYVPGTFPFA